MTQHKNPILHEGVAGVKHAVADQAALPSREECASGLLRFVEKEVGNYSLKLRRRMHNLSLVSAESVRNPHPRKTWHPVCTGKHRARETRQAETPKGVYHLKRTSFPWRKDSLKFICATDVVSWVKFGRVKAFLQTSIWGFGYRIQ